MHPNILSSSPWGLKAHSDTVYGTFCVFQFPGAFFCDAVFPTKLILPPVFFPRENLYFSAIKSLLFPIVFDRSCGMLYQRSGE